MMNAQINVLLAEDVRYTNHLIRRELQSRDEINLLPVAGTGEAVLKSVLQHRVHLLLLDIVLPEYDGIVVLTKMREMKLEDPPVVILCTALSSDEVIRDAAELGAVHCLLKPGNPEHIVTRALELYYRTAANLAGQRVGARSEYALQRCIYDVLKEMDVPPHLLGYEYLRSCIQKVVEDRSTVHRMTSKLYPEVAAQYSSTDKRVERAIRTAIEAAWGRDGQGGLRELFGGRDARPSNSEFIARLADVVRLRCQ